MNSFDTGKAFCKLYAAAVSFLADVLMDLDGYSPDQQKPSTSD
jgi:hypothetical protein